MYGVFGGYTRWAVVFLIIFVLFFLFVPAYGMGAAPAPGIAVTSYHHGHSAMGMGPMMGGAMMPSSPMMHGGPMGGSMSHYGYESPSSS